MSGTPSPFNKGDKVAVGPIDDLIVDQCWRSHGAWQVRALGKPNKDNPKGRFTFAAVDAVKTSNEVQP